jgi:hypothetical protein
MRGMTLASSALCIRKEVSTASNLALHDHAQHQPPIVLLASPPKFFAGFVFFFPASWDASWNASWVALAYDLRKAAFCLFPVPTFRSGRAVCRKLLTILHFAHTLSLSSLTSLQSLISRATISP